MPCADEGGSRHGAPAAVNGRTHGHGRSDTDGAEYQSVSGLWACRWGAVLPNSTWHGLRPWVLTNNMREQSLHL